MKVLWVTHIADERAASFLGGAANVRGGWIGSLAEPLGTTPNVELAIAFVVSGGEWSKANVGPYVAYRIPYVGNMGSDVRLHPATERDLLKTIGDFHPDVVHVHGTEHAFSRLALRRDLPPTVISVQGLLCEIERHYYGGFDWKWLLRNRTLRDWVRCDGVLERRYHMRRRAAVEAELLGSGNGILGRTLWDRAHIERISPGCRYYHVGEVIRKPFFETVEKKRATPGPVLYASSAASPLKGFHVLLHAAAMLVDEFPGLEVRVPAPSFDGPGLGGLLQRQRRGGYSVYLQQLVKRLGLTGRVKGLGGLGPAQVVAQLAETSVFVMPSYIENSSNATAEAMLMGVPCVTAFTGGMQTVVRDEETALCFPVGDSTVLAYQIRRLLHAPELAARMTAQAREIARSRHAPETVVAQLLEAYAAECAAPR